MFDRFNKLMSETDYKAQQSTSGDSRNGSNSAQVNITQQQTLEEPMMPLTKQVEHIGQVASSHILKWTAQL